MDLTKADYIDLCIEKFKSFGINEYDRVIETKYHLTYTPLEYALKTTSSAEYNLIIFHDLKSKQQLLHYASLDLSNEIYWWDKKKHYQNLLPKFGSEKQIREMKKEEREEKIINTIATIFATILTGAIIIAISRVILKITWGI